MHITVTDDSVGHWQVMPHPTKEYVNLSILPITNTLHINTID